MYNIIILETFFITYLNSLFIFCIIIIIIITVITLITIIVTFCYGLHASRQFMRKARSRDMFGELFLLSRYLSIVFHIV